MTTEYSLFRLCKNTELGSCAGALPSGRLFLALTRPGCAEQGPGWVQALGMTLGLCPLELSHCPGFWWETVLGRGNLSSVGLHHAVPEAPGFLAWDLLASLSQSF